MSFGKDNVRESTLFSMRDSYSNKTDQSETEESDQDPRLEESEPRNVCEESDRNIGHSYSSCTSGADVVNDVLIEGSKRLKCSEGREVEQTEQDGQYPLLNTSQADIFLSCHICMQGFENSFQIAAHLLTHGVTQYTIYTSDTSGSGQGFACESCGLTFYPRKVFVKHRCQVERNPTERQTFVCQLCDKRFQCKASLRVHTKTQHGSTKQLQCPDCDKRFHILSDLKRHELTHTGVRPFICTECEKGFTCKSSLHAHLKSSHTVGKLLQCGQCDKSFHLLTDLNRHIRTHTGERPFTCTHCMKGFTCKSSLKAHEKLHIIGKPFQCQFCTKSFHLQFDLSRHERTHTGVKPFQCGVCRKGFVCKSTLMTHKRLIHKNDEEVDMDKRRKGKDSTSPVLNSDIIAAHHPTDSDFPVDILNSEDNGTDGSQASVDERAPSDRKRQRKSKFVQRLVIEPDTVLSTE